MGDCKETIFAGDDKDCSGEYIKEIRNEHIVFKEGVCVEPYSVKFSCDGPGGSVKSQIFSEDNCKGQYVEVISGDCFYNTKRKQYDIFTVNDDPCKNKQK